MLDQPIIFLATTNSDRSRAFFEKLPGLKFVADEPYALVFQTGASILRISKVELVEAPPYTVLGWSVADIRAAIGALRKTGVTFERFGGMDQDSEGIWKSPSGALIAWFRDPEGHVLSLTQYP